MKKIIFIIILLVIISGATLAFEDCPYDEVDCAYPGECGRYIDRDDDGICDKSQSAPEDRIEEGIESVMVVEVKSGSDAQITETLPAIIGDKTKATYDLLVIFLALGILYAVSYILSKKKIIRVVSHRKIWNILLLISFLISGSLGILLVIRINYGIEMPLPFNALYWHVEFSIAMFLISLFHTLWHGAYLKKLFKFK
jgi:hypothetical protein